MPTVVLDTNILVAALLRSGGSARAVLRACSGSTSRGYRHPQSARCIARRIEVSLAQRVVTRALPGGVPMSTLTIRLPDDKHERLKALARSNAISVNKLMDELATVALANFDARVRFETRAARGNPKRALKLLDKLDHAD